MPALAPVCGRRVYIRWTRGHEWQARILFAPAGDDIYLEMVGGSLPPRARKGQAWYALTPDLDVYPQCLSCPSLVGIAVCNAKGQPQWRAGLGDKRGERLLYGGDWTPHLWSSPRRWR